MPVNRNALIRYKTIDNCLRNKYRQWTLDDLIEACSEALYEYEGIDKGVSKRTVQMDIQMMRSEKLGYCAPIVVTDKKYYAYEDPNYSITNIPLTDQDLGKLSEVVDILKQFKGFTHFQELSGMVQKLEDKIHVSRGNERAVIDLEKNENLKGLEFIDPIFQAIKNKRCLTVCYKSFKARGSHTFIFNPALLKEYRNRWFVLGKKGLKAPYQLLALDRISKLEENEETPLSYPPEEIASYFDDVVGVSVNPGEAPQEVRLFIDRQNAPYVITKPIHHSQALIEKGTHGIVIEIRVQINFELEREILGFGDYMQVLSPLHLRRRIMSRLGHCLDAYNSGLTEYESKNIPFKLSNKGHCIFRQIYPQKDLMKMNKILNQYISNNVSKDEHRQLHAIRGLLVKLPQLLPYLLNPNLHTILDAFSPKLILTKAIYFDKPPNSNWYVTWHQDTTINVREKIEIDGYTGWTKKGEMWGVCPPEEILHQTMTIRVHLDETTADNGALNVLPGSHKQRLEDEYKKLITENCTPVTCEVPAGGVHLMKPLLLHASSKTTNNKRRRVIHMEFCNSALPNGLKWAEGISLDSMES